MDGKNIMYNREGTDSSLSEINNAITQNLDTQKKEYEKLLTLFEKSNSEHATELRNLLEAETKTSEQLASLFQDIVIMLENASQDMDRVEEQYSEKKIETSP